MRDLSRREMAGVITLQFAIILLLGGTAWRQFTRPASPPLVFHDAPPASPQASPEKAKAKIATKETKENVVPPKEAVDRQGVQPPQRASHKKKPPSSPININTATKEQLVSIPGIGEKTAETILRYRTANGQFRKPEELMAVKGFGTAKYAKIKAYIRTQ